MGEPLLRDDKPCSDTTMSTATASSAAPARASTDTIQVIVVKQNGTIPPVDEGSMTRPPANAPGQGISLNSGFCVPTVRGEAVIYDPRGRNIPMDEFLEFDNYLYNNVLEAYGDGPVTGVELGELAESCREYMELNSPDFVWNN
ncbi:hypothetical protein WJX73_010712 [Symbiochloris irregularis]|uniref:Uncharacterized protein n=1 Tax=Symbiochloris irregularis TaxID=706552 RepID=A0AAW1Q0I3_9CHLO